jgi:hypothetical protein
MQDPSPALPGVSHPFSFLTCTLFSALIFQHGLDGFTGAAKGACHILVIPRFQHSVYRFLIECTLKLKRNDLSIQL